MKLIKKLLITLIVLIVVLCGAFFGGVLYLNKKYDIDTFKTLSSLKQLSEPVEETDIVKNPYSDKDIDSLMTEFNVSFDNFITKDNDGIHFNFDKLSDIAEKDVYLTDKQLAIFASEALEEKINSKIEIGSYQFPVKILEMDIKDIVEQQATIKTIVRLDVTDLKKSFSSFPLSLFGKYIPTYFYLDVSFVNTHQSAAFSYQVSASDVMINSLSSEESSSLFTTIGKFVSFPTAEECSTTFGKAFMDNLVGTTENPGILLQLKDNGAKDYAFVNYKNEGCLKVSCTVL